MPVAIQIRDVPEDVRDTIAKVASSRGQSMQSYLLELLHRETRLVANVEALEATAGSRVELPDGFGPESIIREGRDQGFETDRAHRSS